MDIVVDAIEKEITVRAGKERVYKAITDPTQLVAWFPDKIEGSIEVGQSPIFEFEGYGKSRIYVTAADPYDYFAYRWIPSTAGYPDGFVGDVLSIPNTLVEFRLQEVSGGTLIKLKESGFASLPADTIEKALGDNTEGWGYMLGRLEALMAQE